MNITCEVETWKYANIEICYQTVGSLQPEEVVSMAMKTLLDKLAYVQMQLKEEVDMKKQDHTSWGY